MYGKLQRKPGSTGESKKRMGAAMSSWSISDDGIYLIIPHESTLYCARCDGIMKVLDGVVTEVQCPCGQAYYWNTEGDIWLRKGDKFFMPPRPKAASL
jgi:hypothetical protein